MVEAKVRANIERYSLASAGQKVVVAVSGGVDSIALLHILFRLRRELKIQLHVASLNHGIRGATAAEDLRFVARLARQLGLPYTTGVANVLNWLRENDLALKTLPGERVTNSWLG